MFIAFFLLMQIYLPSYWIWFPGALNISFTFLTWNVKNKKVFFSDYRLFYGNTKIFKEKKRTIYEFFFHCCDRILTEATEEWEDSFWFTVCRCHPPWHGSNRGRGWHCSSHCSWSQEAEMNVSIHLLPFLSSGSQLMDSRGPQLCWGFLSELP